MDLHARKPPNPQKDQPSWRGLKVTEKSAAVGLRMEKQNESHTDHLNHWQRHHSMRRSGVGQALRLRLYRSVPGSGLGLVGWRQPKGLERDVLWVGGVVY